MNFDKKMKPIYTKKRTREKNLLTQDEIKLYNIKGTFAWENTTRIVPMSYKWTCPFDHEHKNTDRLSLFGNTIYCFECDRSYNITKKMKFNRTGDMFKII